ncbi:hypothetical protein D3C73_809960 [compost metagenome]
MIGRQFVFCIERGRFASIAGAHFGSHGRQVAEKVAASDHEHVVIAIGAAVVVERQLSLAVQVDRRTDTSRVFRGAQQACGVGEDAGFIDPTDFEREAVGVIDAPVQRALRLDDGVGSALRLAIAGMKAQVWGELAENLCAMLGGGLAPIVARGRISRVGFAPPGRCAPVLCGPAQLGEIDPSLQGFRLAFARTRPAELGEVEAAVRGEEGRSRKGFGADVLGFEVGAAPGLQSQISAVKGVILAAAVFLHIGRADADMVSEPAFAAKTGGEMAVVETRGRPFIVHDQTLFEAVQRPVPRDRRRVLARDLRERAREDDAALQLINLIVGAALQRDAAFRTSRGQVSNFEDHHL